MRTIIVVGVVVALFSSGCVRHREPARVDRLVSAGAVERLPDVEAQAWTSMYRSDVTAEGQVRRELLEEARTSGGEDVLDVEVRGNCWPAWLTWTLGVVMVASGVVVAGLSQDWLISGIIAGVGVAAPISGSWCSMRATGVPVRYVTPSPAPPSPEPATPEAPAQEAAAEPAPAAATP